MAEFGTEREERALTTTPVVVWVMRVLAAIAVAVCIYLVDIAFSGTDGCGGNRSLFDCSRILDSKWSSWLGVPVAAPAMLAYGAAAAALWFIGVGRSVRSQHRAWKSLAAVSTMAAGAAVWFFALQLQLGGFCIFCMSVHVSGLALGVLAWYWLFRHRREVRIRRQQLAGMFGVGAIGLAMLIMGQLAFETTAGNLKTEEHEELSKEEQDRRRQLALKETHALSPDPLDRRENVISDMLGNRAESGAARRNAEKGRPPAGWDPGRRETDSHLIIDVVRTQGAGQSGAGTDQPGTSPAVPTTTDPTRPATTASGSTAANDGKTGDDKRDTTPSTPSFLNSDPAFPVGPNNSADPDDMSASYLPGGSRRPVAAPPVVIEKPDEPEIVSRQISLGGGRIHITNTSVPMLGSPNAPHIIMKMFDYTCPRCRVLHERLKKVEERYRGQLAIALVPVPLSHECNQFIRGAHQKHINSCFYARLALAVWRIDRKKFPAMDAKLWEGEKPPSIQESRSYAESLVGRDALNRELTDPNLERMLQRGIRYYGYVNAGSVPKLILHRRSIHGAPSEALLFRFLEEQLKIKPTSE